jgi:hypothetical protein
MTGWIDAARRHVAPNATILDIGAISVWRHSPGSAPEPAGPRELPDPLAFAHDNLVRHGSVQDVLLEFPDGQAAPRVDELMGEVASSLSLQ